MVRIVGVASCIALALACGATRTSGKDAEDTDDSEAPADTEVYTPDTDNADTAVAPSAVALELIDFPFVAEVGDPAEEVTGRVTSAVHPLEALLLSVSSDLDGPQPAPTWLENGRFAWPTATLRPGSHRLTFDVVDPDEARASEILGVDVCAWPEVQDFNGNPIGAGWRAFGNASWDPSGWMEITGNYQSRAGSVYLTERRIDPGNVRISFDIATGGGVNSGADGYSVNIVDVPTVEDLVTWIGTTSNGGCLGYGSAPPCGTTPVNAFHIEFDTWYNAGDPITDPTSANHIAITLDGNPGNHLLHVAVPTLEDLVWRNVDVEIVGAVVTVRINGSQVLSQAIPGFQFDGGWIGVSGSTGWASNFHRFDNLEIRDRCRVPE